MKILVVCQYFHPEEFKVNELVEGLLKRGNEVTVLTGKPTYPKGPYPKGYKFWGVQKEEYKGAKVIRLPEMTRGNGGPIGVIRSMFSFLFSSTCYAKRHDIEADAILCFQLSPVTMVNAALIYKKKLGAKLALWVQDLWPESVTATTSIKGGPIIKWLEDFHNPIYVSKRVGKNGKIFKFYKIRTMCPNAEAMKQKLIDEGLNEADGPAFKMKNDPRITKVGKVFRKLSLDELPQLFNILNGSMSVVGPRPPIPSEVEQYTEYQRHRLDVKGGLLCLWQIQKNRNAIGFDEWVRLDLEYIQKQSVWLDLKIIFKGAFMVIFDRSGE